MYKNILLQILFFIIIFTSNITNSITNNNEVKFISIDHNLIPLNQEYQDIDYNQHYIEENENNTILFFEFHAKI